MRLQETEARAGGVYPAARRTSWSADYGPSRFLERDPPHVVEPPPRRGGVPVRKIERESEQGRAKVEGFLRRVWTRLGKALRGGA